MKFLQPVLILIFMCSHLLLAQTSDVQFGALPQKAIGVLYLSIFPNEGVAKPNLKPISVRINPNKNSKIIINLHSPNDVLESREIEYEHSAAIALNQSNGWFQIETRLGKGWVSGKDVEKFVRVESLFYGKMTYLRYDEWDGILFESPVPTAKRKDIKWVKPRNDNTDAEFIEWKQSSGRSWIKVRLLSKVYCDDARVLKQDIVGWIPAYSLKGNLVMWFFSRGC